MFVWFLTAATARSWTLQVGGALKEMIDAPDTGVVRSPPNSRLAPSPGRLPGSPAEGMVC
jgi:hypothetical protein